MALYLNKLGSSSPKDNDQVWLNLACWFWRRFFKNLQCTFSLSLLSSLGDGQSPSFEKT
jgi:hypothetical protein